MTKDNNVNVSLWIALQAADMMRIVVVTEDKHAQYLSNRMSMSADGLLCRLQL